MYRHILIPLDGSKRAEIALSCAETLLQSGAKLTLLRVTPEAVHVNTRPRAGDASHSIRHGGDSPNPSPNVFAGSSAAIVDTHIQSEVEAATRYLDSLNTILNERGIRAHVMTVPAAAPAEGILQTAAQIGCDLIVIASHGRGGLARLLAGSVADHVARNATVPVLVCHGTKTPASFQRVLVPLDGSQLSERALKHALQIAAPGARVLLQRVVIAPELPSMSDQSRMVLDRSSGRLETEHKLDHEIESAQHYLHTTAVELKSHAGDVRVDTVAYPGSPGAAIVDLAHTDAVDVIVMASHGLAGLRRALMGSVTDHVVRHAECPVLVTHDPA